MTRNILRDLKKQSDELRLQLSLGRAEARELLEEHSHDLSAVLAELRWPEWLQKNTVFKAAVLEDTHARRSCRGRRSVRSGGDAKHKRDRSSHIVQMRFATDTLATAAAVAKMWGLITSGKR